MQGQGKKGRKEPEDRKENCMLIDKAEKALAALLREYMHVEGSGCAIERELKGKLDGYREAFSITKVVKAERFRELYAEAHLEVHGMTTAVKNFSVGVAAQQLTSSDWERFDAPTVVRRSKHY